MPLHYISALGLFLTAQPRFEDVTERSGIHFKHVSGSAEKDYILEVNGSGVALFHDCKRRISAWACGPSARPAA